MSEKMHFTATRLKDLPRPEGKRVYYRDEKADALHLVVYPTGKKIFNSRVWLSGENRSIWVKIGPFPAIGIEEARKINAQNVAKSHKGINSITEKRTARGELTLGELYDLLEDEEFSHLRPATLKTYERDYNNHLKPWATRRLNGITSQDVSTLKARIARDSGKIAANKVLRLLGLMFKHARTRKHFTGALPTEGIKKFQERPIVTRLEKEEIKKLLKAIDSESNHTARDIFKVLLATGARKGSVLSMQWEDLNLENKLWIIPSRSSKNKDPIEVSLSSFVIDVLKARKVQLGKTKDKTKWVFPASKESTTGHFINISKPLKRILKEAKITKRFRTHDFRHAFASTLSDNNIDPIVIQQTLGHRDFASTLRYVHLRRDKKNIAVQVVSNLLDAAQEKKP